MHVAVHRHEDTPLATLASLLESVLESRVNLVKSFDNIIRARELVLESWVNLGRDFGRQRA